MADGPMADGPVVHLVVPCYNEAARLDRAAFTRALQAMPWLHLWFVNDGSTDETAGVLEGIRHGEPDRVRLLTLPHNVGKAEAVRQGLQAACAAGGLCGFWDADLSAPLAELTALRDQLAISPQYEWVWGARVRTLGRHIERRASRHYLGRLFATVASITLGVPSYDTQCGAKLFRAAPLLEAVIAEPFASRWIFDVELLSRANALLEGSGRPGVEAVVFEQPLHTWMHRAGSKVRPTDFVRALWDLVVIREQRTRWTRALPI